MKRIRMIFTLVIAAVLVMAAFPTGNVLAVTDSVGPVTSAVIVTPNPATVNTSVVVTATVDDTTTGGSIIQSAEYSLNGGPWTAMNASDGAFSSITEGVTATFIVTQLSNNEVCVRGTDAANNVGDPICITLVANPDTLGPITSAVNVTPNPATVNASVTVTAAVDDTTTGGSNIQSAEYSLNGEAWTAMNASDGAFDSVLENVTGSFIVTQVGSNQVCIRGTDAANNVGDAVCASFTAQYLYKFSGFRPPIRMNVANKANAPQTIPVKWRLTLTATGAPVNKPSSFVALKSYAVDCITLTGDPSTAVVEKGPGKTNLRYLGAGNWLFNWKTSKEYRTTCRMMFVLFSDGQMSPSILFRFK